MSVLNQNEITELKRLLPRGSNTKIAKEVGMSKVYVGEVINGNYYNALIIEKALRIAESEKKRRDAITEKIKVLKS